MGSIRFISLRQALKLHELSIDEYGGMHGIRDEGLLESALHQPAATFGGQFLHEYPFEMAAAYLFHLVSNHPFIDGNKRIAAAVANAFLFANGLVIAAPEAGYEALVMRAARGEADKPWIAAFLKEHCLPRE
jgi:death-on-curing protein